MRGVSLLFLLMLGMSLGLLTPANGIDSVDARLEFGADRILAAQLPVEGSAAAKRLVDTSRNAEHAGGAKFLEGAAAGASASTPDPRAIARRPDDGTEAETLPAHSRAQGPRAPPAPPRR